MFASANRLFGNEHLTSPQKACLVTARHGSTCHLQKQRLRVLWGRQSLNTERTEHLRDLSVEALEAPRSQGESRLVADHSLAHYEDFRRPSPRVPRARCQPEP